MTARGFYTLLFGALMLFTALSVGSAGAFLLGTAALLCWALSLLCVCAAALSCRAEQQLEGGQTQRGGTCRLILRVRFALPAPIAPLSLRVELPSGRQSDFSLPAGLLGLTEKEKSQILSINQANHPGRFYREVWIGLGGTRSAVYATEVSAEEYFTFTTEESEKLEVQRLAEELDGNLELAIRRMAERKREEQRQVSTPKREQ